MNNSELAKRIIEYVGGKENVSGLTHCVTRLRFVLKDETKANKKELEQLDIMQVIQSGGQYQVVIGTHVNDVYQEAIKYLGDLEESKPEQEVEKRTLLDRVFNIISGSFTPLIPAILGSGMLKALMQILVTAGVLSASSGTYAILSSASNAVFYFLPIILGVTFGSKMKVNPYISAVIGGALLEPSYTSLIAEGRTDFFHIPVLLMNYSSTVFPVILAVCLYVLVDKLLNKIIPKVFKVLLVPMLSLMIVVPITMIVFGPFGIYTGTFISDMLTLALGKNAVLTNMIFGFIGIPTVMFGMHWALIPVIINNLSTTGQDFLLPTVQATAYAGAGAALGVFLRSKDLKLKEVSFSAFVPAFLTGITEPVIYGIFFKFKRALIYAMIMSGVAGGLCGIFHISASQLAGGILTIPSYTPAWSFALSMAVAFLGTFLLVYFFGYETREKGQRSGTKETKEKATKIYSPAKGKVIPLNQVKDEAFSSGMLGKGIGVLPSDSNIYAPVDGTVVTVFPTKHAIGIRTDSGVELVIHIGINTVNLGGKYFDITVKEGDRVTSGQLIGTVDHDKIKEEGYDTTIMMVVTNTDVHNEVNVLDTKTVEEPVIEIL